MKKMFVCILVLLSFISMTYADLIIYPAKGQSDEQKIVDKKECKEWAKKETGIDPDNIVITDTKPQSSGEHKIAGGAAAGAAMGGALGSFNGNFGKGAAMGATAGAISGAFSKLKSKKRAKKQQASQKEAKKQHIIDKFNRAYGACLEAKGYTVK